MIPQRRRLPAQVLNAAAHRARGQLGVTGEQDGVIRRGRGHGEGSPYASGYTALIRAAAMTRSGVAMSSVKSGRNCGSVASASAAPAARWIV
jgi:hypothetical protein